MKVLMKSVRWSVCLLLAALLTVPAAAQNFPFPGSRDGGIGVGDVISIIGGMSRDRSPVYTRGRTNDRGVQVETLIGIGTILYDLSRQGTVREGPTPYPYPHERYPADPSVHYPDPSERLPHPGSVAVRPSGYDYISNRGAPIRLDSRSLPLTVNAGDTRNRDVVRAAIDMWNGAGVGELFRLTNGAADLTVDWSGRDVSPGARAETRMTRSAQRVVPTGLLVRTDGRSAEELARVVAHELGHVVGLDHSNDRSDIMYRSERRGPLALSHRDQQMVQWLYAQPNYTPVIGKTRLDRTDNIARYLEELPSAGEPSQSVCRFHSH